jgi:catechol-2,3-dioxygenase
MTKLKMGHLGLHVRNIEEEMEFLELLGAEMTSMDTIPSRGRIAFVSLDGVWHHNFALFEDGSPLESGDSQKERQGIDHIAMCTDSRASVDEWLTKLTAKGIKVKGPQIQGPEGGGLDMGSSSYTIFFHDPNGICFEIFAEPDTVSEFRARVAAREAATVDA